MSNRLAGKVAVVTGAGSGLGRAAALMFADEGAAVACADINLEHARQTADQITASGGIALPIRVDVSNESQCLEMVEQTLSTLNHIDIVYSCAGIAGPGSAAETTVDNWQRVLDVNLAGKWLAFKHVIPQMIERGRGSIIVQASVGGLLGVPGTFPYSAAKGGCISMVKQAAIDLAPHGIRVNAIAPASIPTPLVEETYRRGGGMGAGLTVEESLAKAGERYPLGRVGTVTENAYLATYVASDEASWTTGHVYVLDGGLSIS